MKKTIISIAVVIIMSVFLQSCFEIKEIIRINKDGSGTFSMVIDLSEVKAMIEGFNEGEDNTSESPLAEMEEEYVAIKSKLEVLEGISNITFVTENGGYMISTSFDFSSVDALNSGMNVVYEDEYGSKTEYYKLKKKTFERTPSHNLLDQMKHEMGSEDYEAQGMDLSAIFSDVVYVNEVTFTDRSIKKTNNEAIEISEDGSTMTLKRFIFRENEDLSMDYVIKVK